MDKTRDFSNETVSKVISDVLQSVQPTHDNPVIMSFCMEDFRFARELQGLTPFLRFLKKLEGRKILAVEWKDGDKPYIKNLSIATE